MTFGDVLKELTPVLGSGFEFKALHPARDKNYTKQAITDIVSLPTTKAELNEAVLKAAQAKQGESYPVTYVLQILRNAKLKTSPEEPSLPTDWRESWSGIVAKGEEYGIIQGEGEPSHVFRERVEAAVEGGVV